MKHVAWSLICLIILPAHADDEMDPEYEKVKQIWLSEYDSSPEGPPRNIDSNGRRYIIKINKTDLGNGHFEYQVWQQYLDQPDH